LIGPWAHAFPHDAVPGPSIGFLQEALRWWDHWLKGADTGIMDEPLLRVWMQDSVAPQPFYEHRPGRWVAEESWPSPRMAPLRFHLNPRRLNAAPRAETPMIVSSPQTTGLNAGEWCAFGADGEMPTDQRPDDGRSLCFDSDPLDARLEILGAPVLTVDIAVDRPVAMIAVRLNEVAPDGASTRVTYGLLNLTHRDDHSAPMPLEPGQRYRVAVRLNDIAHAFSAGSTIRLAISTSYWPIAWPTPEPVTLTVFCGAGTLDLPVRPPSPLDAALPDFPPPERGPSQENVTVRRAPFTRKMERDLTTGETIHTLESDGGELGGAAMAVIEAIGLNIGHHMVKTFRIGETDPLSARGELRQRTILKRDDWSVRVETETCITSTAEVFRFVAKLRAYDGEAEVFTREWDDEIPRDLL
ncbi:MAG: CocE/NonD family hydrolase, partial [Candidatus Eiseniibacteriota bacterium]